MSTAWLPIRQHVQLSLPIAEQPRSHYEYFSVPRIGGQSFIYEMIDRTPSAGIVLGSSQIEYFHPCVFSRLNILLFRNQPIQELPSE